MEMQDFMYDIYDYDIAATCTANVSKVNISDDDEVENLNEPKEFHTLTNIVNEPSFDLKDVEDEIDPPSTDMPIIETYLTDCKSRDSDNQSNFADIDIGKLTPDYVSQQQPQTQTDDVEDNSIVDELQENDCTNEEVSSNEPPSFTCNVCNYQFKQSYGLKRHMQIHTGESLYKCTECSFESKRSESLKKHMKTHSQEDVKLETKNHSEEQSLNCSDCDYSTTVKAAYIKHKLSHSESSHKCSECDYSCKKLSQLKIHTKKHAGDMPFQCNICSYITARKCDFIVHLRNHTTEKLYKCMSCGFCAKQFVQLKRHIKVHDGTDGKYACNKCEYETVDMLDLKMHVIRHFKVDLQLTNGNSELAADTIIKEDKFYKCTDCKYTTKQSGNLRRHQKTHIKGTFFECIECSFSSKSAVGLKKHVDIAHSFDKAYKCTECDHTTSRKYQMDIHMVVHNGKQLYECNICGYKSVVRYNLTRHRRTHANDKLDGSE